MTTESQNGSTSDDESCRLCPGKLPSPTLPIFQQYDVDELGQPLTITQGKKEPVLKWIGCEHCNNGWYHAACVALEIRREASNPTTTNGSTGPSDGDQVRPGKLVRLSDTLPGVILEQICARSLFWDWTQYIDQWFCASCISSSSASGSSSSPQKFEVKLKENRRIPSKPVVRKQSKRNQSPSSTADGQEETISKKRPKRQAALLQPDYKALHNSIASSTNKWLGLIANPEKFGRKISDRPYTQVEGTILTKSWLDSTEVPEDVPPPELFFGQDREPIIVPKRKGGFASLGGRVPDAKLGFQDVANLVGREENLDVIDVATQMSSKWTLGDWADYITNNTSAEADASSSKRPDQPRTKVYNVISLEVSGTELAKKVRPPKLVSEIDWVDKYWPDVPGKRKARRNYRHDDEVDQGTKREEDEETAKNGGGEESKPEQGRADWPKVQLYCLMGMKGSFTEWHLDMGSSSVYYTVHTGSKTFFFIRPTEANLAAYAKWSSSYESQHSVWLGDWVDEVRKVTLMAGDTMIIPAGYIHAVYTPMDSLVFGGNFLHSYNIENQLRLRDMEIKLKVPQRYRFPFFDKLCWYAAIDFCQHLKETTSWRKRPEHKPKEETNPTVLQGFLVLSRFLIREIKTMEDPSVEEKQRKAIHGRIPTEMTHDPAALARELRWRCQRALGEESEDEADKTQISVPVEKPKIIRRRKLGNGVVDPSMNEKRLIVFGEAARKRNGVSEWVDVDKSPSARAEQLECIIRPWTIETAEQNTEEHNVTRPMDHPDQVMEDSMSTQEDSLAEVKGHRDIVTTRQIRKRKRTGRDGCVVEEEQEVLVKTTVTRWSPKIGSAGTEPGFDKDENELGRKRMGSPPLGDKLELIPNGESSNKDEPELRADASESLAEMAVDETIDR